MRLWIAIIILDLSFNGAQCTTLPTRASRQPRSSFMIYIENWSGLTVLDGFTPKICNGALIRDDWVITAASCIRFATEPDLIVFGGATTIGNSFASHTFVKKKYIPLDFQIGNYARDVGLLHLEVPLIKSHIKPIGLLWRAMKSDDKLVVFSYGHTNEPIILFDQLKNKPVQLLDQSECAICGTARPIDAIFCAYADGDVDSIVHDAGSVLIRGKTIAGILAGGCQSIDGRAVSAYVNISRYYRKIMAVVRNPKGYSHGPDRLFQ